MQEMQDQSLGQVDPPEKEMATHASIHAWGISWTEEPGGLQSMGLQKRQITWRPNNSSDILFASKMLTGSFS